jgi:hypothetical protein
MRILSLLASLAGMALALAGPAAAGERLLGLGGSTLTTSTIDPYAFSLNNAPGGTGPLGALILKDPRFRNVLAPCDDPNVLGRISTEFAEKESWYWNSPLRLVGFDRIRATAVDPWGRNNIPRLYCVAKVLVNDGRERTINYNVIEDQSLSGYSFGVEWCVQGLDRGWSFAPNCRMARP